MPQWYVFKLANQMRPQKYSGINLCHVVLSLEYIKNRILHAVLILIFSRRFQTELGYDFLEIHDGPNLLSPLVGSFNGTQVPQFLFSSSNFLYLLFTTDNSRSNAGFKILYESMFDMNVTMPYLLKI